MSAIKIKTKKQEIFLPTGAFKINRKGQPEYVKSIIVPEPDDCCGVDCCDNTIKFIGSDGVQKSISLEALYNLVNPSINYTYSFSNCIDEPVLINETPEPYQFIVVSDPIQETISGTWTIDNEDVGTIDEDTGLMTFAGDIGEAIITFTPNDGSDPVTCVITTIIN